MIKIKILKKLDILFISTMVHFALNNNAS